MVRRLFLYPVSHQISPKYINCLAAHLAMCLSTLADPLSLRGLFLYFRTLKLPKVTSCPCTNTWLNNRSQRWAEIFVGTLHIKATDTYIQMSSVVCARIEKRHLGILGRGAVASLQSCTDCSSWFLLFNLREQMSPYYAALLTCITDVGTFLNTVYLRSLLARAGYRVWSFLGTDRIASIPLRIEKCFVLQYQISIWHNLINVSEPISMQRAWCAWIVIGSGEASRKNTSLRRLHPETWLTHEAIVWKRQNPIDVRLRLH